MKHQILIASYRRDFRWLKHCLASLSKYSVDFLTPVVALPSDDVDFYNQAVDPLGKLAIVKTFDGPGFGRAQAAMMSGDLLCPDADYIWLLGSDCLATRLFSPADYCDDLGRPVMLWNTWAHMEKHAKETVFWKNGVAAYTGLEPTGEFMRRLPLAYPRDLFAKTRHVVANAGRPDLKLNEPPDNWTVNPAYVQGVFNEIVFDRVNRCRNFSESNILGEIGYRFFHDKWNWVNIDKGCPPDPAGLPAGVRPWPIALPVVQHWSHGGVDRPRDQDGRTPRSVIAEALGISKREV